MDFMRCFVAALLAMTRLQTFYKTIKKTLKNLLAKKKE